MFNRSHPLKLWTSSYPVHISEIGTRTHQIDDIMHDGFQPQKCHRSIYELANVTVYKNQLLSISSDGTLVNILGAKAERRNEIFLITKISSLVLIYLYSESDLLMQKFKNNYNYFSIFEPLGDQETHTRR